MLYRKPSSHKGQNGKIAIIGGSEVFHGAPIFASLAAEATGVDLIFPVVPVCHMEVTKYASYNFICTPFYKNSLSKSDLPNIQEVLKKSDVLVIGPGLGQKASTINTAAEIISNSKIPVVIDADGLKAVSYILKNKMKMPENCVLTPHIGEFIQMTMLKTKASVDKEILRLWAKKLNSVILLKGETDIIISPEGKLAQNKTGNAGLTVGGTGDALSGVIGGLITQREHPFEAASIGSKIIGTAGDKLYKEKGYMYKTIDVIHKIPEIIRTIQLK